MRTPYFLQLTAAAAICFLASAGLFTAQTPEIFKARLSPLPIDAKLAPSVTGHGSVSAVLAGTKLNLTGTFNGMSSAATVAHIHQGKIIGLPGAVIHELMVSKAVEGSISGSLELTPSEADALRKGLLYVVVHSTGAPEGNLWGWLLK